MKKYLVRGRYKGKKIHEVVVASSKKQAKLMVGFRTGFGGNEMSGFLKSRTVKVRVK